jgi:uncharacterized membrane protein YgcG
MKFVHINIGARRALLACAVAAVSVGSGTAAAQAKLVHGTVVHHNRRAHSFVVADRRGDLFAIHARRSPRMGTIVAVKVRRLRNGTFAAKHVKATGHRRRVRIRGTVSYVNRRRGFFVLSARGVSMVIRRSHRHAAAADAIPSVGAEVTATGTIDDQGELEDQAVQDDGTDTNGIELEGTVLAVDPTARILTISADDNDRSGASVSVTVPDTIDIAQFAVGQEVELSVLPQGTGFVLAGSASDEGAQGADDQSQEQGDQGEDPGSSSGSDGGSSGGSGTSGSDGGSETSGSDGSGGGSDSSGADG